jgi:hypothetical protein
MATTNKTTKPTPLERMKAEHKDKETLVDRVLGVIHLGGIDRETMKGRLLAVSNKKLLRLLEVGNEIKQKYGSPEKLVEAAAAVLGKAKDKDYVAKLGQLAASSPARLLDMVRTAQRRKTRAA